MRLKHTLERREVPFKNPRALIAAINYTNSLLKTSLQANNTRTVVTQYIKMCFTKIKKRMCDFLFSAFLLTVILQIACVGIGIEKVAIV